MKSKFAVLLSFLCVVCLSCNSDKTENKELKTIFYEDGKTIHQSIEFKNGKKNGYMKSFYRNGKLKASQFYINDTLNDTSAMYYPDGRLQSLQIYKNKRKHGRWQEYNKEGRLYSEIYFKNGMLDSTSKVFTFRTGRLLTKVTYKDGVKNGAEERYYSNGKPQSKTFYDRGRPCLGTEEWLDNGKKINNDFSVSVTERNKLLLDGTVTFIIKPEGFKKDDEAYTILPPTKGKGIEAFKSLTKTEEGFELSYQVQKGGHIMTKEYVAIFRKTPMRNTYIKVHPINVAIDNY